MATCFKKFAWKRLFSTRLQITHNNGIDWLNYLDKVKYNVEQYFLNW